LNRETNRETNQVLSREMNQVPQVTNVNQIRWMAIGETGILNHEMNHDANHEVNRKVNRPFSMDIHRGRPRVILNRILNRLIPP